MLNIKKGKYSIRTRLRAAFIGLAIGPLLLLGIVITYQSYMMQKEQAEELQQEISKRALVQITNYFDALEDELRMAAKVNNIANLAYEQQYEILSRIRSYKNDWHKDVFNELVLLDSRGRERMRRSRERVYTKHDLNDRSRSDEFRVPVKTGEVYYSPVSFDKQTGEPFIKMGMPLTDMQTGLKNGVLVAEIRLKDIWELIAGLHIGSGGSAYIVNQDGLVIAHKDHSLVLRGTHFKVPEEAGIYTGLVGTKVVIASNEMSLGGQTLYIVTEKPVSEVLRLTVGIIGIIGILFIGAIAAAVKLGLLVRRLIIQPIEALADTALAISNGDLTCRAALTTDDEIGTLANAFNSMAAKLVSTIDALKQQVAERTFAEGALADEKERLTVTLGSIGDAVIATDTHGTVVLINKVAADLTGWSQKDAMGKSLPEVFNIINEKTLLICENPVEKALSAESIIDPASHAVIVSRDGTERIIADSAAPIRDRKSRIIGTVLVFRDITEKHKIEQELLNAKKLESIAILAAGIAHEINNPLTNASLNLQVLKKRLEDSILDREILNKLESVQRNMDRASMIAKELLVFSRQRELEFKPINIINIITDVLTHIKYRLNNVKMHQDLVSVPDIVGDPVKLGQVLINVFNNSFEAMPKGGDIFISTSFKNGQVEVKIADTGTGIPEGIMSKVFDPFFTTKEIGVGTGLGLAICYGIINQHKGNMEISSALGRGTDVCIKLPVNEGLRGVL